jgi:hypothetical protein
MNARARHRALFAAMATFAASAGLATRAHAQQCPAPNAAGARRLSAAFDAGRVLLAPVSPRGDTTYFILDSGGGFNAMAEQRVTALGLAAHIEGQGRDTGTVIPVAAFGDSLQLPVPLAGQPPRGFLAVTRQLGEFPSMYALPVAGFMGGGWWADRVWRIDYLRKELWLFPHSVLAPVTRGGPAPHQLPLFFRVNAAGRRTNSYPRVRARIDGD